MDSKRSFRMLGLFALAVLVVVVLFNLANSGSSYTPADTSQIVSLIDNGQVKSAKITDKNQTIQVTTNSGKQLQADWVSGQGLQLQQELQKQYNAGKLPQGYTVTIPSSDSIWSVLLSFIPYIIIALFFFLILSQMQGGGSRVMNFGKSKAKLITKDTPKTTFADVAGADEAIEELQEIKEFLANPAKFQAIGAKIPKGVLLYGPPGTGKTLLARAVAGEAGVPFYSISGSDFVEMFVGVGASRVRDLFEQAKSNAPAIVFVDEIDAVGRHRGAGLGGGHDEREQTLNQMLVELDGFDTKGGVIVIAATNRPDILDPALLRPGRFDRQVVVDVPDVHGRFEILELHAKGRQFADGVDLYEIAKLCPGFSGAELANLINEAALLSVREGYAEIDQPTLEEAIDRVVAGPAKKTHVLTEDERWRIAVHESGHAVATRSIGQVVSAQKLSIVARGRQLGTSADMLTDKDATIHSQPDLERHLVAILAGTAAEWNEFGHGSTGASDDLHAATKLARQMVTSFGMSPALGPVTIGEAGGEVFLGNSLQDMGSVGPDTLDTIDDETERLVEEAKERALYVLRANWGSVQETAHALLEHETLSGVALDAVLSTVIHHEIYEIEIPEREPDRDHDT